MIKFMQILNTVNHIFCDLCWPSQHNCCILGDNFPQSGLDYRESFGRTHSMDPGDCGAREDWEAKLPNL